MLRPAIEHALSGMSKNVADKSGPSAATNCPTLASLRSKSEVVAALRAPKMERNGLAVRGGVARRRPVRRLAKGIIEHEHYKPLQR